jgi:hypothetical protein
MPATHSSELSPKGRQLHGILKRFAINVDPARLERTLPRIKSLNRGSAKPGAALRALLQDLDRPIDSRLASEIEYEISKSLN